MRAYREAFTGFYSLPKPAQDHLHRVPAGADWMPKRARSTLRQFMYYFFSYRQGRHPMVGGVWQIRRRDVRRAAITDDEAYRHYLGGMRFDAILRGDGGGFAAALA